MRLKNFNLVASIPSVISRLQRENQIRNILTMFQKIIENEKKKNKELHREFSSEQVFQLIKENPVGDWLIKKIVKKLFPKSSEEEGVFLLFKNIL